MPEVLTAVGAKAGINVVGNLDVLNGLVSVRRTDLTGPAKIELSHYDGFVTSTGSFALYASTFGSRMVIDPGLHGDSYVEVAKKLVVTGELVASSSLGVTGSTTLSGDLGLLGSVTTNLRIHKTNPVVTLATGSGLSLREATITYDVPIFPRLTINPGSLGATHITGNLFVSGVLFEGSDRVVERGSNADGSYVKFANGLMICWHRLTLNFSSSRFLNASWTYPVAFVSAPDIIPGTLSTSGSAYTGINLNTVGNPFHLAGPTSTGATVGIWSNHAGYVAGNAVANVMYMAIGLWK